MSQKPVVLITGANSGFGRLTVETLARKGHHVFATLRDITGRNAGPAQELRAWPGRISSPSRSWTSTSLTRSRSRRPWTARWPRPGTSM